MKENLLKIKDYLFNLIKIIAKHPVTYWISRNTILVGVTVLVGISLLTIPKITTYLLLIVMFEMMALVMSGMGNYLYTQQRLNKPESNIITAAIFIGVHILVALTSFVFFSDLIV